MNERTPEQKRVNAAETLSSAGAILALLISEGKGPAAICTTLSIASVMAAAGWRKDGTPDEEVKASLHEAIDVSFPIAEAFGAERFVTKCTALAFAG